MPVSYTVGDYLVRSLYGRGVKHVFGVPGDYILSFYERLTKSKISVVNMCDEQGAGFAADAYARISGLGVVCVTYGVGALKVINTTAQAYAEMACAARMAQKSDDPQTIANRLADKLQELLGRAGLARSLKQFDIGRNHVRQLAVEAARQWTAQFNPRPIDVDAFEQLYRDALNHT